MPGKTESDKVCHAFSLHSLKRGAYQSVRSGKPFFITPSVRTFASFRLNGFGVSSVRLHLACGVRITYKRQRYSVFAGLATEHAVTTATE